jgi:acyl carrier protein
VEAERSVSERILDLVRRIAPHDAIKTEIQPHSLLADVGITSIGMVDLMLGVEAEFDLTIPQTDITAENFRSVDAIAQLVVRLGRAI